MLKEEISTSAASTHQEMSMIDLSNRSWMTTRGRFREVSWEEESFHLEQFENLPQRNPDGRKVKVNCVC